MNTKNIKILKFFFAVVKHPIFFLYKTVQGHCNEHMSCVSVKTFISKSISKFVTSIFGIRN
jgi:hypothetical protein